jgi:hypothetical protein
MQTFAVIAQHVEFGPVQSGSAGQNTSQALQDGFYRGLIGQGSGRTQQHSISIFSDGHGT